MPIEIVIDNVRLSFRPFRIVLCLSMLFFLDTPSSAQPDIDFEEVSVLSSFKLLGSMEIPAIIQNEKLYLSLSDLFDFLKITNDVSPGMDSLYGSIQNQKDVFLIEKNTLRVSYRSKIIELDPDDLLLVNEQLFLLSNRLDAAFGLQCLFNIRALTVSITSTEELPVIRMLLLESKRLNYHQASEIFIADTTIENKFRLFHFGSADWSVNSNQYPQSSINTRFGLALGGVLAGGEFNALLTHTLDRPFLERQQHYQWKYAHNKSGLVRQIIAGKISPPSISSIFDPVVGVQITNTPTYTRKSFGFYTISDFTEPNSIVEIYLNNSLFDYIKTDATGMYTIRIPLEYGSTDVTLKFYGPNVDKEMTVKKFIIPLSFLPENEFEYRLTAGIVQDSKGSLFSQGKFNYGLTNNITIGAGMEYIRSIGSVQQLPFLNASIKLSPNLAFTGEYVSGVRYKGILTYHSSARLQFELNYTKYEEAQEAVQYHYIESRKAVISMPFRFLKGAGMSRLSFSQNMNGAGINNSLDLQLSYSRRGMSINMNTYAYVNRTKEYKVYSTVASSVSLPGQFKLTPRVVYNMTDKKVISLNVGLEKNFGPRFSAFISFEERLENNERYCRLGFRRIFSFARVSSNFSYTRHQTSFFQSASGSIIHDRKANYLKFTNHSSIGKGGVAFISFLDLNGNGKRDAGEQTVKGLNVTMFKSGGMKTVTDSSVIIVGLEPAIYHSFILDGTYFDNLSWRISQDAINIMIAPSQIKFVEVAVVPVGEVSGSISRQNENALNGLGRIKVNIYNSKSVVVATVISEKDGYFSFLGLSPGLYTAVIDEVQLAKIKMSAFPNSISFSIGQNIDGDIVDTLAFILKMMPE
ncbi:MAG TPA: hypothetical protein VLA46_03530 [Saprospiraceae bacterium]|nr:hypothetical protein [Saprospiraceae bacterium]